MKTTQTTTAPATRIILTDDDADDRSFFSEAFTELEMKGELRTFCDGKELMDYLRSAAAAPHVVILDLNMPRKSGFECINEIRSDKRFSQTSIAVYSTSASDRDIETTFKSGADIYIKKPSDYNMLKKMVRKILGTDWSVKLGAPDRDKYLLQL